MHKTVGALLFFLIAGLAATVSNPGNQEALSPEARQWVEQTLSGMSLEEKVGQVIMAGTQADFTNVLTPKFDEIKEDIQRYHVGGYLAFPGDVLSAALLIRRMQEMARIPLFIASDLEGGTGLIFDGATRFPKAMALAATGDPLNAYTTGKITALEARNIGININFYPDVDVNNNPNNPIINIRSFGESPELVSKMAAAYIRGVQENGLLATAKHFPGHGDTSTDSHLELPVIQAGIDRLNRVELPPFRAAIEAGVGAIMAAHIAVPALEGGADLPATLSRPILTGLLRRQMEFRGLVFTDAMTMGGIVNGYKNGEAVVRAFRAGADVILYPPSVKDAFEALLKAVRRKRIQPQRLDSSVRRILEAKARLGLFDRHLVELYQVDHKVGSPDYQDAAQNIMNRAITLVRDQKNVLPFSPRRHSSLLLLTVLDEHRYRETRGPTLVREFSKRVPNTIHFEVSPSTSSDEIRLLRELARRVDYVVAGVYIRVAAFKGDLKLSADQIELLRQLSSINKPFACIVFGSPYLLSFVPELPSYLLAFDDYPGAETAAARTVLGELPFRGTLPVSLPEEYALGDGIRR